MPRRKFPYDEKRAPGLDLRIQARGGPQIDLTGIVDSGASTTVLSREHAGELGIETADLHQRSPVVVADDSEVPCWTSIVPIRAQVLRQPAPGDLVPWGPVFALEVVFLEHATPLWGQNDFFAMFKILFERDLDPATFELIC